MLEFDFKNSLGFWVCSVAHLLRRDMNAELHREGITYRQWEVLACLALGDTTQAEISDRLGIEPPTLVGVLERMERDGWLTRTVSFDDRRVKVITVSQKAETVWNRMVECALRVRAKARIGISDAEYDMLCQLLDRIQCNLDNGTSAAIDINSPESRIDAPAQDSSAEVEIQLVAETRD